MRDAFLSIRDRLDRVYAGRPVDAAEALSIGLVNRVVNADALDEAALDLARRIARNAPSMSR